MNYYQAAQVISDRLITALPTFQVIGLVDSSEIESALKNQHCVFITPGLDRVINNANTINPDVTTVEQNWVVTLAVQSAFQQNTLSKLNRFNDCGEYVSAVFDALQNYQFSQFFTPFKRVNAEYRPAVIKSKVFIPLQFSTVMSYAVEGNEVVI